MFIFQISPEVQRTLRLLPQRNGTLFHRLMFLGTFVLHLKPFTQYQFFVPPGTHYWVDRTGEDTKMAFERHQHCGNQTLHSLISGPTP